MNDVLCFTKDDEVVNRELNGTGPVFPITVTDVSIAAANKENMRVIRSMAEESNKTRVLDLMANNRN